MSKEVVIVGAGVVGCLIAKVLKKHDIPFKILEKNKEIRKDPRRTVALTSDSIKFLNSLEKELDLNAWATPVERMHLYQKSDLNLVLESKEEKKVTSICLLDDLHEKILSGLDSDILWDEDIKNIGLGPNIQIKTQENEFTADLLFATDGMNSNVRKLMHFDTEEWFYGQKAYVAVVRANHKNIAKQYFSKFGTLALLPLNKDKEYYSIILCTNSTSNADEQLKSLNKYFYEYFVIRGGSATLGGGSGSSVSQSSTDATNKGIAYKIYGCGIYNGDEEIIIALESSVVLPRQ